MLRLLFQALKTKGGPDNFDLLPVFMWQTQDVYPSVQAHRGDFHVHGAIDAQLPSAALIDVFATNAAKTATSLVGHLSSVAHRLHSGSLLVFADFLYRAMHHAVHDNQVLFVFGKLDRSHLRLVGHDAPYGFFEVVKPMSSEILKGALTAWKRDGVKSCVQAAARAGQELRRVSASAVPLPTCSHIDKAAMHAAIIVFRRKVKMRHHPVKPFEEVSCSLAVDALSIHHRRIGHLWPCCD